MSSTSGRCLRCGEQFNYDDGSCPSCNWSSEEFRERGRYNLQRPGTGDWNGD